MAYVLVPVRRRAAHLIVGHWLAMPLPLTSR